MIARTIYSCPRSPGVAANYLNRLVLAGARGGGGRGSGENGHTDSSWSANYAAAVDLHLTLARTLVLHGAFEEAGGHARAAERLAMVEGGEWSADDEIRSGAASADGVALHLDMALLTRTPVVLESGDSAITLRRELLAVLEQLRGTKGFLGSIPNPLNVGVRSQFLATYQVRPRPVTPKMKPSAIPS